MKPLYTPADRTREFQVEDGPPHRSAFRRDYARLLHSPAFRRLQGKTQLFPSLEHDFFRNRLTHSLEVAQVAKSIALRLNHYDRYFQEHPIDTDLVETAALAHDLGHPPFGHNGERALDDCMKDRGGFEGNAQSLRILATLSKKEPQASPEVGLNLTHRTLAAILKYDKPIPIVRKDDEDIVKGYYHSEKKLVKRIKKSVLGETGDIHHEFKTVECQIMDIADDIAYSTYDLEDALKSRFINPLQLIFSLLQNDIYEPVAKKVAKKFNEEIRKHDLFKHTMGWLRPALDLTSLEENTAALSEAAFPQDAGLDHLEQRVLNSAAVHAEMRRLGEDGTARTDLTARLVHECVEGTQVVVNGDVPSLSKVELKPDLLKRVEILKHLTYELVTQSSNLKTVEYRGSEIVCEIFEALSSKDGHKLLPDDYRKRVVEAVNDEPIRCRAICDFIAGMTDRYAIEFYGRLRSESAQTIFKPL